MTRSVDATLKPAARRDPLRIARLGTVVAAHPVVDAYAGFVTPLIGVLQVRCDLTVWQAASLLSIGPVMSGLSQPIFAWLTDRIDSRLFGTIGVAVAAASLSCVGLATNFQTLVMLFALGMLGVGAFHPVGAASSGQLAGRRRSAGVTLFFVAGMIGAVLGPIISTRVTKIEPNGFDMLRWLMIPGLILAVALYAAIRNVPHRHHEHHTISFDAIEARRRWSAMALIFVGNAMRYSVNLAMLYLYVRWAEAYVARQDSTLGIEEIASQGSLYSGELIAVTMFGVGAGGLAAGFIIRAGKEKLPFILLPLLLAPSIALLPHAARLGTYGLAMISAVGYGSIIPLSISLAQRLLPHRTSLASSLVMGGAWTCACVAAPVAQWCVESFGLERTFALVACLLAASGVVGAILPGRLLRQVAAHDGKLKNEEED